ncbi:MULTISPECIES: hemagglutinin repeat-containing protein [unclassified Xanthomonas]|uniref:hemagglutinin repeat-containing protein n=1 Tax=Xanthomonas sp. LMG 9002 TaxID=1591158 RepID=UPI00136F063F|nr:hemagglutinin repeat-containing protein [Xanthomonas sp. LMG 9002]
MDRTDRRHRLLEPLKRGLAALLCCTVTWTSLPLYAQVAPVANPDGRQPGQQAAANGVPVVDIVAPNARGVSHNRYSRFDVGSNGLILNNSAQISKTELGGYIAGNDNLKNSGAATLILNEVTSTTSRLQGYTEIAGAKAQLVIANPNGIVCDGCGFLNTSRVTLATGVPLLGADGALNGFSITGGALSVGSNGLDAYNVDRLDLLSRQLSVGGSVWAKDLLASAGAQRIGYDGMLLEVLPGSDGAPPAIGIDVAYLGGMYADRIRLIATEAGVGVVSRGTLSAQSGSLQIDSAGQLSLAGTAVARDDVELHAAGALSQQGVLGSQQAGVRLRAAQLTMSGDTIAHGLLDAAASGALAHSGRSSAGAITLFGSELDAGGSLYSGGDLSLSASGELRSSGSAYAGGAAQLQAGAAWLQRGGTVQSAGRLAVQAARIDAAGALDAGAGLNLRSDAEMRLSGLAQSWQDASVQAGGRLDTLGQLSAGGRLDLGAAAIGNAAGAVVSAGGDIALATPGTLDNAGTLYAGRDLRIDAASVGNSGGSYAGRNATLATTAALSNSGSLVAGAALSVDAAQLLSSGELGSQGGDVALRSRGDLALAGQVAAKGALTAQAGGILLQSGTLRAGSAQLQTTGDAALDGVIRTDGDLQLSADGQLRSSATLAAGGNATLHAQGALLQSGQVQTGGALALDGASIAQAGVLDAGTTLALRSAGDLSLAGTAQSRSDLTLTGAGVLQNQAQVVAGGALSASAGSLSNAAGASLSALGDASLSSASALSNDGHLYAGGALGLRAGSLAQTGSANAGTTLTLTVDGAVANQGDLVGGSDVQIDAGSLASSGQLGSQHGQVVLNSRGDVQLDGVVAAAGALNAQELGDLQQRGSLRAAGVQLAAAGDLGVAGTVQSTDTLQLQAQRALRVDGQASANGAIGVNAASVALGTGAILQSATALQVETAALDSQGALDAGTDLRLHSTGDIHLAGIAQAGRDVAVLADGNLDNQSKVFAGRALQLTAASASNQAQGQLLAQTTLDATVQGNFDNAGLVQAGQAASLRVGSLQQSGRAYAGDTLTVQAATALGNTGDLIGKHDVAISAGSVASSGQLGSQDGQLSVTSAGDLQLAGTQVAGTALHLQAAGDLLHGGTSKAQSVQLDAGRDLTLAGTTQSASTLQAQAQRALQLDGQALAGGSVHLRGASVGTGSAAVLQSVADIAVDGGSIDSQGALDAGTDLTLHSQAVLHLAGIAQGGGDVLLTAAGAFDSSARVVAGRDLQLQAASAVNRAAGTLAAGRGLDLHVDGLLDNAGLLRGEQSLQLQAGSLQHSGTLSTGQALTLRSSGAVDNRGNVIAGGDLLVDVGSLSNSGQLGSQNGQVTLTSQGDLQLGGSVIAAQALSATAQGDLRLDGVAKARAIALSGRDVGLAGGLQSATNATLQAQRALSVDGQALTTGDLHLKGASVATGNAAVLQSTAGAITLQGGSIDSRGTLDAATDLGLRSDGTLAVAGVAQAGRDVVLTAGTQLTNAAQVLAGRDLTVTAAGIANATGASLGARGALALTTGGTLANAGTLQSGQAMTLQVGNLQHSGQAYAGDALTLHATGAVDSQGDLIAKRDLQLDAARIASTGQLGSQSGQVALTSQGDLQLGGSIVAAQALSATALGDLRLDGVAKAGAVALTGRDVGIAGALQSGSTATLQAQRALSVDGQALTVGDLQLQGASVATGNAAVLQSTAGAITLQGGSIDSRGTLDAATDLGLRSDGTLAVAGVAQAGRDVVLTAGTQLTNAAQVLAGRDLTVTAAGIANATGASLGARGALALTTGGTLANAGTLQSGQAMTLQVGNLQHSGQAYAGDALTLHATGAVDSQGDLIAKRDLQLDAARIASTGQLGSQSGQVVLTSQGDLQLGGTVAAATQLSAQAQGDLLQADTLSAQALDLRAGRDLTLGGQLATTQGLQAQAQRDLQVNGSLSAGQDATLQAGGTLRSGSQSVLHSTGALRLSGAAIDSQGTADAGTTLAMTSTGDLALGGLVQSASTLDLRATGALNNAAQVVAGTDLSLTAASATNSASGMLAALGNGTFTVSGLLSNAGALRARQRLQLDVGSLQQTGRSYGVQRLALTANGAVDNRGDLIGGNALRVQAASVASSGQLGSESGDVALVSQGDLTLGGTLASAGAFSAQAGGALNQSGALSAATTLQLQSHGDLTVAGTLSANQVVLGSDAGVLQHGTVNGADIALQGQRIDNAGQTLSSGNLRLSGGDVAIGGVAASGVRSDGSLGNSGALTLHADGTLSASGRLIAAGNLTADATQLALAGSTTRVGGNAALTASGDVDHRGADLLAGGQLTVRAGGALDNSALNGVGGTLQAAGLDLGASTLRNGSGSLVQSGTGITRIAVTGAFDNGSGRLVSNGSDLQLGAASINNAQGRIEHAGSGTLTVSSAGALGNAGGRILTQGQLQLSAGNTLDNQGGAIAAAGDASVTAAGLGNIGGSVSGRGLNLQLGSGALDNRLGVVQATGGSLVLRADSLENRGGTIQALSSGGAGGDLRVDLAHTLNNDSGVIGASTDLTLGAENVSNSAGTLQAGRDLALTARGQLDNHQSGRIGAARDLTVAVNGALLNSGGQLDSGNAMTLSGGRIDNSQGSIVNNGGGLTRLTTGGDLRNVGGSLGGRGSVVLDAASIANGSGQLVAGGDLIANTNALDNQGGSVYAGASMLLQRNGATLDNRNGKIKAEQAVRLALQNLSNSGGQIGAGSSAGGAGDVVIDTVGFDGGGSILGQNLLDLTIRSDYTHRAGADITSNGDFRLAVGGNFVNASALQAGRSLGINASNISNLAGASMRSGNVQLNTGGSVGNAGDISASGNLQVTAGSVSNTGSLVGGNVLVDTGTLINGADLGGATDNAAYGSALIGATSGMTLLVRDQLVNRDAKIFSLGNIAIGAARDSSGTLIARTGTLDNVSGSIEADGSILIAANQINNRRRVVNARTTPLSDSEREAINATTPSEVLYVGQPMPEQNGPNVGDRVSLGTTRYYDVISRDQLISASAEGRIAAGGNIAISGSVNNNASTIAAAGQLLVNRFGTNGLSDALINGREVVQNNALALSQKTKYTDIERVAVLDDGDCARGIRGTGCTYSVEENEVNSGTSDSGYIALAANMTGGQGVAISGATISNGAVGSDGRSIGGASFNATQGGGLNRYGTKSADGAGGIAVQAQTAAATGGASVGNRIAAAGFGQIRVDDGRGSLVGTTDATAVDVHAQGVQTALNGSSAVNASNVQATGVQAQLGGAGNGSRSQVQANGAQAVLTGGTVPGQYQQIDPGTGQVPQVVGGVGAPLGNIVLPMGGLYRLVGSNGANPNALGRAANGLGGVKANNGAPGRRYLIETDPRFVDYNNFISSDYLLDKLGVDPQWTQTRLGDGFYEQRLVLDQITQLTGRRYLGNYADGVAQYRALLDGGVAEAGTLHLSVGVALTAAQVAALTHDIVWMVEQEYQGQKVLVPVVYLSSKTALTLRSDGALLASDNGDVSLNATAGLSNTGTISGANVSANVGNLLNQGRIVSSGTVALQANQDLLNLGGQITGRDVLLSAGRDLTSTTRDAVAGGDLRSGISAGNNLLLQAGRDLSLTGTTLQVGNNAALQAGSNLLLQPTALRDESGLMRGGDTSSLIVGGNLQLAAGNDLTIRQAQVKTGGDLIAAAGHNLDVTSVLGDSHTVTDETRQGKTKLVTATTTQDLEQQALTAGGNLVLSAGHDVNLTAAKLDAGNGLAVVAGNDLNSTTLTTVDSSNTLETRKRFKQTTSTRDETVHGSEFTAGGDIALQSGHDVNLTAAQVFTDKGALAVSAGNDVNLLAAQEQHDAVQDMQKKKKGFLSSKTTTTHDEWHDSTAVATTLSGDTVQIAAGHDLLSQGAQVAGTGNVVVAAGNDLTLETAQNTHSEEHEKKTKKSGMFGSGGIGVTFGTQKIQNNADTADVTHVGSTVGSVEGDVTLVAGNRYAQTGSDVLANAGDITVKAKDIAITEVHDTTDAEQRSKFSQGGLSITLSSAALSLAQSAYDTGKAGSKVSGDARMQALAAGSAAYSAYGAASSLSQTGSALASGNAASAAQGANISIAVTVGGSKSESKSTQSADQAKGSKLQAGGDVNLIATGGGDASNLLVSGSDITAGRNLLLAADHDVTIEAAKNTAEQHSTSKSSSAAVGVAVTYGADGFAAGVTLSASGARGKANGEDVSYANSHVTAGNNATIISGNDTTLKGAQVSADKVIADVGGNLNIESLQDTSTYASKDKSVGGSVTFGMGFSASASYSSNKVNGDYASVTEQSGIQAGKGGFDITVGGNTDLKGAVIASSQEAIDQGKNRLSTGTLTYSDIANASSYDAKGISLSGGYSVGTGDDQAKGSEGQTPSTTNNGSKWSWQNYNTGANGSAAGYGHESGDAQSTTHSGISGGALVITDEAGQQAKTGKSVADTLAGLKRDVVTGDDVNGLTKQWDGQKLQEQVAAQAQITATFGQQATHVIGDYAEKKMTEAADLRRQANDTTDPDQKAQLTAQADQLESQWGNNGSLRVLAHTVVGGLTGGLEGATGAAAGTLAAPAVATALRDAGVTGPLADTLTALASTAAGAVAGGTAGAATASNEVVNNYLSHPQRDEKARELSKCKTEECRENVERKWDDVSLAQSREMKDRYFDYLTPEQQAELMNLKPGTKEYDAILAAGVSQYASKTTTGVGSSYSLDYQLLTERDWNGPQVKALIGGSSLEDRNRLDTAVLGIFGSPARLTALFGGSPEQVAAANNFGASMYDVMGAVEVLAPRSTRSGDGPPAFELLVKKDNVVEVGFNKGEIPTLDAIKVVADKPRSNSVDVTETFNYSSRTSAPDGYSVPILREILASSKQLDKKFKHASDFGVGTSKKNPQTLEQFKLELERHMKAQATVEHGTYGFVKDSRVFFNPDTNNVVVVDAKGNFVTGFKLDPGSLQFENFIKNGVLR